MMAQAVNHLWQSTLFAAVAGLLTMAFRSSGAHIRYWLWFAASLKFLLPFWLLLSLGSHLASFSTARSVGAMASTATSQTVLQLSQPFSESLTPTTSRANHSDNTLAVAWCVWALGCAGVMLIRYRGWLRIRAAVRASSASGIPSTVEIRSTPGLIEPGVAGFFRPILLLPIGITERLTPDQFRAVLAHELCHVRRRDNLTSAIHMIVEALFWFHPLVWWIGTRLVQERERACDEEVLRLGSEPGVYAEGILNVCKSYLESPLRCVAGVTGSDLKKRIHTILTGRIARDLNITKRLTLAVAAVVAIAAPIVVGLVNSSLIRAQPAAKRPKFDVASIRPCKDESGRRAGAGNASPGTLDTGCTVLVGASDSLGLIQRAYVRFANGRVNPFGIVPITGGPAWIHSQLYLINAKAEGNPSPEMMQGPMLQALLEDRFQLKVHRETKQVPVYALTVAKGGAKLEPSPEGSCVPMPMTFPLPPLAEGQKYCRNMVGGRHGQNVTLNVESASLDEFAKLASLVLDRPVIDKTGIAGKFAIRLEFAIGEPTPRYLPGGDLAGVAPTPEATSDPPGPSIFAAMEQIGLKLERAVGPREFLVIDHVARPSEN